ncbi:MAG: hypothetical protein H6861_01180 [Rhodospirillales bacterium]|nr:hypothetical protein [Rhodospirillales bacterium]
MVAFAPVPTPETLLPLMEMALKEGGTFAYRMNEDSTRPFYVHPDTVAVAVKIMNLLKPESRQELLDKVPMEMTSIFMKCWEIEDSPEKFQAHFLKPNKMKG